MIVYAYKKCSTCKKALLFLEKRGVVFTEKEITKQPPSLEELQQMLKYQKGQVRKLFNTSGLLYKEMQLKDRLESMPLNEALALLNQHGMLVKRPFVIGKHFGLIGFNEKAWEQAGLNTA